MSSIQPTFKSTNMGELLSENIYDILSRLPVKSLARFRCVSKQWCNYIGDPYLEIIRNNQGVIEDPMLIMFHQLLPRPPCPEMISLLESKEAETGALNLTKNPTTTMEFRFRECRLISKHAVVLGSCKGLLYSSQAVNCDETTLVVIHPLRKECYQLPPIKMPRCAGPQHAVHGLGFDDSSNIFKMVCLMSPMLDAVKEDICTMVHVLGTDSWRVIPQVPSHPICGEGIFAHGFLHWLTSIAFVQPKVGRSIIRFDVRNEEFGLINLPEQISSISETSSISYLYHLVDLDGQVGFVYWNNINKVTMDVWVLKRTGWVIHCRLDRIPDRLSIFWMKVLGFWNKDGDILITKNDRREMLFVFNLKSGVWHKTNLAGRENGYVTDIRMYPSSMFSICYSIKIFMK